MLLDLFLELFWWLDTLQPIHSKKWLVPLYPDTTVDVITYMSFIIRANTVLINLQIILLQIWTLLRGDKVSNIPKIKTYRVYLEYLGFYVLAECWTFVIESISPLPGIGAKYSGILPTNSQQQSV